MECPKCGNKQDGTVECSACGLIFEKYRRHLEKQSQVTPGPTPAPSRSRGRLYLVVAGGAAGMLLGGFLLSGRFESPVTSPPAQTALSEEKVVETSRQTAGSSVSGPDIQALLAANTPAGNPIEEARNATVLLKTHWGLGSGFFIDDRCSIITNRHVVKLSDEDVAKAETRLEEKRGKAKELKALIQSNKDTYEKFAAKYPSAARAKANLSSFEETLAWNERALQEMEKEIQAVENEVYGLKWNNDLDVILADGNKYIGVINQVSSEHDLALVGILGGGRCPSITVGDVNGLAQGDKLFTIGSPMGIRHTVTSGIFSGRISMDGKRLLQTDAPINPGNSGGPLVDQEGRVVGINTMVMNSAQGIGFAIPIDQAIESFRLE